MFSFDKYCLSQKKLQAAGIFLCGTEERDCKSVFKSLSAKGKR